MDTILQAKFNKISRYGKRICGIDTKHSFPCERVYTFHFNGMFHTFLLRAGIPVKYKQSKNW